MSIWCTFPDAVSSEKWHVTKNFKFAVTGKTILFPTADHASKTTVNMTYISYTLVLWGYVLWGYIKRDNDVVSLFTNVPVILAAAWGCKTPFTVRWLPSFPHVSQSRWVKPTFRVLSHSHISIIPGTVVQTSFWHSHGVTRVCSCRELGDGGCRRPGPWDFWHPASFLETFRGWHLYSGTQRYIEFRICWSIWIALKRATSSHVKWSQMDVSHF